MTTYTKIAVKGAATVLVMSILAAFLGYVARVILARSLSIEEFGLFYAVFAFLGLVGTFKSLGFDKALAKFIPEFMHKKQYNFIKSSIIYVFIIQLITNLIVIFAVYLMSNFLANSYFHNSKAELVLKLLVIAFSLDSFVLVLKFAFQGFNKMRYFSGIDLIRMLLIIAVIIIGLKLNYGILSPVIAYVIVPLALLIIFGYILTRKVFCEFFKSKFSIDNRLLRKISNYSIFVLATTLGGIILGYTDIIMLTYFSGLASVALYSVALPTAKILIYFPRAIGGVLLPLTSELWSKGKQRILVDGIESLYKYSIIIILPLVFMLFSFSDLIINILFGGNYKMAAGAMRILSIGMIFATMSGICSNFFSGIGKPQISSKMVYAAAFFNFIANLILIPLIGIVGAAISTTISYFIMMVIGLVGIKKFISARFPVKIWAKTLASGMIFILLISLLKKVIILNVWFETPIVVIISFAVYVISLFLLKVINVRELENLYKKMV